MPFASASPNPLTELVEFERSVKHVTLGGRVALKFSADYRVLTLSFNGQSYLATVERPLIHQLGARLWRNSKDYGDIEEKWNNILDDQPNDLIRRLEALFRERSFILKYFYKGGNNIVYGLVTDNFVPMDQLEFRTRFIEIARQSAILQPVNRDIERTAYGAPVEYFGFDSTGYQIELKYGLVYAKNNGYDALDVEWGRMVLVCSNGLRRWHGERFKWHHTQAVDIDAFIHHTIVSGIGHQQYLEKRISIAATTALDQPLVEEFLARLSLGNASKQRLRRQLELEMRTHDRTDWALSQALTWSGTHERALPLRASAFLTEAGSDILEQSLSGYLQAAESYVGRDGFYGGLLPSHLARRYSNKGA